MIKINPVSENEASPEVKQIFADIKSVFDIDFVPFYFQVIATVPSFLTELWTELRPVVDSADFVTLLQTVTDSSIDKATKLVPPDPTISLLVTKLSPETISSHRQKFLEMQRVNIIFLSIAIIVREAIKGFAMISDNRPHFKITSQEELLYEKDLEKMSEESGDVSIATIPNLPSFSVDSTDPFFLAYVKLVSELMDRFDKTNDYLTLRLPLENKVQLQMRQMSVKFALPYGKILEILQNHPAANELIYLLHEAFPSYFPKQFISAILLETCLSMKNPNQINGSTVTVLEKSPPKLLED